MVGLEYFEEDEPQGEEYDGGVNPVGVVKVCGQFEVRPDNHREEDGNGHHKHVQRHNQPCRCDMQVADSQG